MKTSTSVVVWFASLVACNGSTQRPDVVAPPSAPAVAVVATVDAGAEVAPVDAAVAVEAVTPPDAPPAAPPLVGVRALAFRAGARPPLGVNPTHGATVWAVTLGASAGPSPALTALFDQATAAHLAVGVGEVNCTPAVGGDYPGAMPTGEAAQIVTVTFRSERDARQFAAALTEAPLRTGRVRVLCAD